MEILKKSFGITKNGVEAYTYTLENAKGMKAVISNYGATIVSLFVPDQNGDLADVVLGYKDVTGYEQGGGTYFGALIGRNGNRIAEGRFVIDGETYQMPQNENGNNLHSGPDGYDSKLWTVEKLDEENNSITLSYVSPDKEQGFPGNFEIAVTYTLNDENALEIDYKGKSDKKTVANLTNHSYFNLGGHNSGTILDHEMLIYAKGYNPVIDSKSIPTGEIAPVEGTPFDFTVSKKIGQDIDADFEQLKLTGGYDHNFVLDNQSGELAKIAEAVDGKSGRKMEVYTDLPGVQFYAGNFISNQKGKEGAVYEKRWGFCMETQYYPNAVNEPSFPSPVIDAGQEYHTVTVYKFV